MTFLDNNYQMSLVPGALDLNVYRNTGTSDFRYQHTVSECEILILKQMRV